MTFVVDRDILSGSDESDGPMNRATRYAKSREAARWLRTLEARYETPADAVGGGAGVVGSSSLGTPAAPDIDIPEEGRR